MLVNKRFETVFKDTFLLLRPVAMKSSITTFGEFDQKFVKVVGLYPDLYMHDNGEAAFNLDVTTKFRFVSIHSLLL